MNICGRTVLHRLLKTTNLRCFSHLKYVKQKQQPINFKEEGVYCFADVGRPVKVKREKGHAHTCISELSAGLTSSYNLDGCQNQRLFSTQLTPNEYEEIAEETLDSLTEMFEDIQERFDCGPEYDVSYSSGVLTVKVNPTWGTYVINKQSPNKQIWFSSPKSGPKRYDYVEGVWVYKHDGRVLHDLLTEEITEVMGKTVDFTICSYGNR